MTKTVVITGAGAGVGRATALEFARHGYDVALLSRDPDRLDSLALKVEGLGRRVLPIPTDVADPDQVEAAADRIEREFGAIDTWVNVAMATVFAPVEKLTADEALRATQVTYLGQVYGMMAALKRMRPRRRGVIVNVGSALAYRSVPLQSVYCGAKAAIRGFTDSLRSEIIHDGLDIQLTMVHLPAVNTPQFDWALNKMKRKAQPVAPIFEPEVAARAIFFGATHSRREVWVGVSTIQAIVGNMIAPGLLDRFLADKGYSGQLTETPLPDDAPGNLFQPVPGHATAHGRFDSRARSTSWEMFTERHRDGILGGAAALGLIGMSLFSREGDAETGGVCVNAGYGRKMTIPLEDFGMIGDGETVALVSTHGSIDWLCLPRFDSPACCSALLGTAEHGHWTISPEGPIVHAEQRYQSDTMVLETDLTSSSGAIRLTDFMPIRAGAPVLIRMVTGLSGTVHARLEAAFRFDYGNMPPWVTGKACGAVMHVGPDEIILRGSEPLDIGGSNVSSRFVVTKESRHFFILTYRMRGEDAAALDTPDRSLAETQAYWREWIGRFDKPLQYGEVVRRSLLILKALIHRPTGGLVAAPTTSLPEQPGGKMNWDYRYCWLRDAAFAVGAFVECGYLEEASAWRDWVLRAVAGEPDKMQIMYRVDGSRRLDEAPLPWLPGYRFAKPVRIGNSAAGQRQLDVFGELIRTLHASEQAGMERVEQGRHLETAIVRHVERVWNLPDQGLWESRGEPRHYTYSKVMAWLALEKFLKGRGSEELADAERERIRALCTHIHGVICREGFDAGLSSFTSYFGSQEVDASLLLLPKVGFLPADDERIAGTIALIEKTLVEDGLVRRHRMVDLVPEGAFLACSFWLAECQLGQNRRSAAVATIERALATRGRLGLLSEQYNIASGRLAGNYPQALSHLALVHAVLALSNFDRR